MAATGELAPLDVNIAADLVVLTVDSGVLKVLLVVRGTEPFRGKRALPGGFLRGVESLEETARRELMEETGLDDPNLVLEQVGTYSAPGRDPRVPRVITCSFLAITPAAPIPTPRSDAADAELVPVDMVVHDETELAFDHVIILRDALAQTRRKLRYTTLATAFCATEFTISELRAVYEAIWGIRLDRPNFYRKVTESEGFVVPTSSSQMTSGRPARLYRAGEATLLSRPIMYLPPEETDSAASA